jgi:hypothetical protein
MRKQRLFADRSANASYPPFCCPSGFLPVRDESAISGNPGLLADCSARQATALRPLRHTGFRAEREDLGRGNSRDPDPTMLAVTQRPRLRRDYRRHVIQFRQIRAWNKVRYLHSPCTIARHGFRKIFRKLCAAEQTSYDAHQILPVPRSA